MYLRQIVKLLYKEIVNHPSVVVKLDKLNYAQYLLNMRKICFPDRGGGDLHKKLFIQRQINSRNSYMGRGVIMEMCFLD